jgi:hypothetical protein
MNAGSIPFHAICAKAGGEGRNISGFSTYSRVTNEHGIADNKPSAYDYPGTNQLLETPKIATWIKTVRDLARETRLDHLLDSPTEYEKNLEYHKSIPLPLFVLESCIYDKACVLEKRMCPKK